MATSNIPGDLPQTRKRNVAPGYDSNPAIRGAQASADAAAQQDALTSISVAPGYDANPSIRNAQASADAAAQKTAVTGASAKPAYDNNPTIRNAQADNDALNQYVNTKIGQKDSLTNADLQALGLNTVASAKPIPAPVAAASNVPGNPQRAALLEKQLNQPVTGPRTPKPAPAAPVAAGVSMTPGATDRLIDFGSGIAKTAGGLLTAIPAEVFDQGRMLIADATDSTLTPEQQSYARDRLGGSLMVDGFNDIGSSFSGGKQAVAQAIGATPATAAQTSGKPSAPKPEATKRPGSAPSKASGNAPGAPAKAEPASGEWANVGGGMVARTNAEGVTEFSNQASDVKAAKGNFKAPAGTGGQGGGDLASLGSASNLGNGKGTFSVLGEEGDAQLALERYDRAAQENAKARLLRRSMEGSGIAGTGDSGQVERLARKAGIQRGAARKATLAELDAAIGKNRVADAADVAADARKKPQWQQESERTKAGTENSKALVEQQLLEASAQQQTARAKNLTQLEQIIADPNSSTEQRADARQTYDLLTTPAKDRFITVKGGENESGAEQASKLYDTTRGDYVEGSADAPSNQPAYVVGRIHTDSRGNQAVFKGYDANGNAKWEKI